MIKKLLSLLLKFVDEKESGLNEVMRNVNQPKEAIRIIKTYKVLLKAGRIT